MKKLHYLIVLIVLLPGVVCAKKYIPINLEYAVTAEQRVWGLMQRKDLPQDHGMLFIYPRPQKLKFWMFNCLIDLSIAFLDNNSVITEIRYLKAYPEMMDLERPVINLEDLDKYSYNDPILEQNAWKNNDKGQRTTKKGTCVFERNEGSYQGNHGENSIICAI